MSEDFTTPHTLHYTIFVNYTVGHKKRATKLLLSISLINIDRFLKSFYCHTLWKTSNNAIIKYPTTP